jgi:hypothetical protein
MTNLYTLYYNKDKKNAIATETKEYFNRIEKKTYYYEVITTADAVITYHFDKETNEIKSRFVD